MEQCTVDEFSWRQEFGIGYGPVVFSKKLDRLVSRVQKGWSLVSGFPVFLALKPIRGETIRAEALKKAMKLFLITFLIRSGDSEYVSLHTTKVIDMKEAERRAIEYLSHFWSETHQDDEEPTRFWREDDTECIEIDSIERITSTGLVKQLSLD